MSTTINSSTTKFRPTAFSDIVGQDEVRSALSMKVQVYKNHGKMPGHILLLGPRGLGKTTLAEVLAAELGARCHMLNAANISGFKAIRQALENVQEGDVVFVDEIHRLKNPDQEALLMVLEDFALTDVNPYAGLNHKRNLPRFTFIGATTHKGKVLPTLYDRFEYKGLLSPYSVAELTQLVSQSSYRRWKLNISQSLAFSIARLASGNARNADTILKNVHEVALSLTTSDEQSYMNVQTLDQAVRLLRIDPIIGLDYTARKYLVALGTSSKPQGLEALAAIINEQASTIESDVEAAVLRDIEMDINGEVVRGPLAQRTGQGRVLTTQGQKYLDACRFLQDRGYFANEQLH